MDYTKTKLGYLLKLDEGEELLSSLSEFAAKMKIKSATLSGLGAAKSADLAHYDTKNKKYNTKRFEGMLEIVNAIGNISRLNDKPSIHVHLTLGLEDYSTVAGHLMSCVVKPTCEISLICFDSKVIRKFDEKSG